MNTLLHDDPDTDNAMTNLSDEDESTLSGEESSQATSKEKRFDVNARRKIEDYLENKRLASLTRDFLFDE